MERWKQERANCGKGEKCRKSKRLEKPNWEVKSIQDIGFEGSQKEVHLEENIVGFQSFFFLVVLFTHGKLQGSGWKKITSSV